MEYRPRWAWKHRGCGSPDEPVGTVATAATDEGSVANVAVAKLTQSERMKEYWRKRRAEQERSAT